YDVVLTTGGTSVGHKDHVLSALDSLGNVVFHRVRIRPGKPLGVARLPDQEAIALAIPGKPIGAHTVTTFVARTFFTGETELPTVSTTIERDVELGPEGFEYVIPVSIEDGTAMPLGHEDSPLEVYSTVFDPSVLSSSTRTTRADGAVITTSPLSAGQTVDVVLYSTIQ
ncbi:MAG: molybdopterin-binding protein, partial [Halobacteriaceae archaeon]